MSSSAIVSLYSFNLFFFAQVLSVLTSTVKYSEYTTDKGKNITMHCGENDDTTMWVKETGNHTDLVQTSSTFSLKSVTESDAGIYICLKLQKFNETNESDNSTLTSVPSSASEPDEIQGNDEKQQQHFAYRKIKLIVRTTPGPVNLLWFKASTILGYLIWRFNATVNSGGYPVRSFTAYYREISSFENQTDSSWNLLDPINISPNVRQMEVFKLKPNSTYEFRIWANNHLGAGEIVSTTATTLPETKEEDLIRLISDDLKAFDPRVWIAAVSIVLGTFVILAIGLCILLAKECYYAPIFGTTGKFDVVVIAS